MLTGILCFAGGFIVCVVIAGWLLDWTSALLKIEEDEGSVKKTINEMGVMGGSGRSAADVILAAFVVGGCIVIGALAFLIQALVG